MGKLVPFYSNAVKKVTVRAERSEQHSQAQALIREAAQLLSVSGDGQSSVQWILEDCIDLLKGNEKEPEYDPYAKQIAEALREKQRLDPRLLLNRNSLLESSFRKKKKD